jgi:HlyD family secretion protein
VNGATQEEREIALTNVLKAQASVDTIKASVDELTVKAPIASQVYQIGAEIGEYVSPGVPLLSLIASATSGCGSISARIWLRASRSATG